jgi:hypothetical protein
MALAFLLLGSPATAIELLPGDLLIADNDNGIVRIDGTTYAQQRLPDPGGLLVSGAGGVAISAWPGNPAERLIWVASGTTLRGFDRNGVQRSACGFTDQIVFDVAVAEDGTTLYSVGAQLRRHQIRAEFGIVVCDTEILIADVEDDLGSRGISLALRSIGGNVTTAYISFSDGAALYNVGSGALNPIAGIPTPEGDSVVALAWVGALVFTQLSLDVFVCEPASGVFVALFAIEALSQGDDLRCPRGIAFDPDVRPEIFVSESQTLFGGTNARLVRLTEDRDGWSQQIVTSGGFLSQPANMLIVPEPGAGPATALGVLAVLGAARRRRDRAFRH